VPRRARITVAGVPHHVVQRGHNRQATFFADEDYLAYRHSLKEGAQRYRCSIHAYALMTNHVHLLVTQIHILLTLSMELRSYMQQRLPVLQGLLGAHLFFPQLWLMR
jgi:REP element-mobilizing transposase RayT